MGCTCLPCFHLLSCPLRARIRACLKTPYADRSHLRSPLPLVTQFFVPSAALESNCSSFNCLWTFRGLCGSSYCATNCRAGFGQTSQQFLAALLAQDTATGPIHLTMSSIGQRQGQPLTLHRQQGDQSGSWSPRPGKSRDASPSGPTLCQSSSWLSDRGSALWSSSYRSTNKTPSWSQSCADWDLVEMAQISFSYSELLSFS